MWANQDSSIKGQVKSRSRSNVVAKLAAKEAEHNTLHKEAKSKEEIAKMEAQLRAETTRIESELARRTLELEQMEVKIQ